jgi:glutamyl-tRNA synthetase
MLLRLEDLDMTRCRPEFVEGVLRDLAWLGLDWDGPVLRQSDRLEALRAAADRLVDSGAAYRCLCTRAELESAMSAPQRGVEEFRYPGTCRDRSGSEAPDAEARARPHALRFRVPAGRIEFVDGIAGACRFDVAEEVGDFIISNRQRVPAYQLAVIVDDAEQGVTEVFRGDDLLSSTPRQILLARALALPIPSFFHVPLVLDAAGRRLAKRCDDLSLAELRVRGVDPRAILGWVAHSAGLLPDEPRLSADELRRSFDVTRLSRAAARLEPEVLARLSEAR